MALLPKSTRKKWFDYLGLGEYNKVNILKFQKMAFSNTHEHDAVYGKNTDIALRHWHHVKLYTNSKNFRPEEFKCTCGKCTGYPTWMRVNELKHIQTIRTHYGRPMEITSALRCPYGNSKVGGVPNSAHLSGKAVDFYIAGVTDTLEHRRSAINYIKRLKNHDYSYGDGITSTGAYKEVPQMGNAIHTQVR